MKFIVVILFIFTSICSYGQQVGVTAVDNNVENLDVANLEAAAQAVVSGSSAQQQNVEATTSGNANQANTEKVALSKLSENEIPVHLSSGKKAQNDDSPIAKAIMIFGIFAAMLCGAWYFLKKGKFQSAQKKNAPEIKVLGQHYLGPKKSLAIIRVAGESILLGVTENNISMIKSLSLLDEEVPENVPQSFAATFHDAQETEAEDYSITGIRDFVSNRLKTMRNLE